MNKILTFLILSTLMIGFINALTFEGTSTSFSRLGYETKELTKNDNCLDLSYNNWQNLKEESGILAMILHFEGDMPNVEEKTKIVVYDANNNPVRHKTAFGINIASTYGLKELQNGSLVVPLEALRNYNEGQFRVCVYFDKLEKINLVNDSEFGSYKIPYFDCEGCFVKSEAKDKYKVGQKTELDVDFKNAGYADANLTVFWDNEIFTKWFRLRDGQASWEGTLGVGETSKLAYNFIPIIPENFVISPAVLKYTVNGYTFQSLSNPIIVGTVPYLDTINCEYVIPKYTYNVGETANIEVLLYNDYDKDKSVEVILNNGTKTEKQIVTIGSQETKRATFALTEKKENTLNLSLTLEKAELGLTKECGNETIGFTEKKQNYLPIIVLILILISIATFVYYYYFL